MANQNVTQLTQQTGSATASSLFYAVTGGTTDTGLPLSVLVNNLGLTGIPTAPTATAATSTTQIASTAFVQSAISAGAFAPLAGATFTGNISMNAVSPALSINDTSGSNSTVLLFRSNGTAEWNVSKSSAQNFNIGRYVAGTLVDNPISIATATGIVTMVDGLSGTPINSSTIGATTPSTGAFTTLSATGNFTPSQTNGIVGTTTNNNANAGSVGEYISSSALSVAITSGTQTNMTSISLTAGDWDVEGVVQFNPAGTTVLSNQLGAISTTSGVVGTFPTYVNLTFNPPAGQGSAISVPRQRLSLSATTTVYVIAEAGFSVSTCTANGFIQARRVR